MCTEMKADKGKEINVSRVRISVGTGKQSREEKIINTGGMLSKMVKR